jgi:hypothetical protein
MLIRNSIKSGKFYQKSTLFEGTNDVVGFGEPADLTKSWAANELTLSAWAHTTSLAAVRDIIGKAAPFAAPTPLINVLMGFTTDGRLFGYFGSNTRTTSSASAGQVVTGQWYHVALTIRNISGTQTGNVWLNGVKQGSDVTLVGTELASGIPFRVGGSYVLDNPDVARPFVGYITEVTAWSAGFTQAQVQELMPGGKPGAIRAHSQAGSLLHYWRMGTDDAYPTIRDRAGSSDGTCAGMVSGANNFVAVVP